MINWQNGTTPINETNMNKLVQEDMITDAYSSSSTYAVGDYCIYENTLYKCTTAISTAEAWNSGHWRAVTVADEINARVKKAGDRMSGDLTMDNSVIKIAKGQTKGIYNTDGLPILRDHNNTNVTIDASMGDLFLGYENTQAINMLNGKVKIDSNGYISGQAQQTTATVSSYFSTVGANKVIKFGNVVHVVFSGYVNTAIPNNTPLLTLPYPSIIGNGESGMIGDYGGQYTAETPYWAYVDGSGNVKGGPLAAGKWLHFNFTYITSN